MQHDIATINNAKLCNILPFLNTVTHFVTNNALAYYIITCPIAFFIMEHIHCSDQTRIFACFSEHRSTTAVNGVIYRDGKTGNSCTNRTIQCKRVQYSWVRLYHTVQLATLRNLPAAIFSISHNLQAPNLKPKPIKKKGKKKKKSTHCAVCGCSALACQLCTK